MAVYRTKDMPGTAADMKSAGKMSENREEERNV